jgi:hypothetical protein
MHRVSLGRLLALLASEAVPHPTCSPTFKVYASTEKLLCFEHSQGLG